MDFGFEVKQAESEVAKGDDDLRALLVRALSQYDQGNTRSAIENGCRFVNLCSARSGHHGYASF